MAVRRPRGVLEGQTAQLSSALPYPGLPAVLHSGPAKLLWCFIFSVSPSALQPQPGNKSSVFEGKGKQVLQATGEMTYIERSLCLGP